jgi:hypothetical protein
MILEFMISFFIGPIYNPKGIAVARMGTNDGAFSVEGISSDGRVARIVFGSRKHFGLVPLPKTVLERVHLERFRLDHLIRTASLPFCYVDRGPDPPDFLVDAESGNIGVDVSVLGLEERRHAFRLFDAFIDHIASFENGLQNLADTRVTLWFGYGEIVPPKRSNQRIAFMLAEALGGVVLDRKRMEEFEDEVKRNGMPSSFPDWYPVYNSPDGTGGFCVSLLPAGTPVTGIRRRIGFECNLHFGIFIDTDDKEVEIRRLVVKHDKSCTDWLILSVGGPDADGYAYPDEDALYGLAQVAGVAISATYIRRVTLHRWSTGEFFELTVLKVKTSS